MRPLIRFRLAQAFLVAGACAPAARSEATSPATPPLAAPAVAADTTRAEILSPGVTYRYYWMREGPWAVHVLDIDRDECWTLRAAKTAPAAIGRSLTSAIVAERAARSETGTVVGGVNADFFLFAPPGVPLGAHVEEERVVTGPTARPVIAIDAAGRIVIDTLSTAGWLAAPSFGAEISAWNRLAPGALALFDTRWGARTDTATGAVEIAIGTRPTGGVLLVDTLPEGVTIPAGGAVLVAGARAPLVVRRQLASLKAGTDTVTASIAVAPFHPRHAVGGFPIILRDGMEVSGLDSAGGAGFGPRRHPRTAAGVSSDGRRILLVVVDGRQPPYSDGMTLRELARLMRDLGASDAINLDGGGSSTMVIISPGGRQSREARVVNRPSDREGERAVGNALVAERGKCTWTGEPSLGMADSTE